MCLFNTPSMPQVKVPDPVQSAKEPDTPAMMAAQRTARGIKTAKSTLLTGLSGEGAAPTSSMLGRTTLLGG